MDELLIFAAMSVASSLVCLHVIMLDNEEMGKSIGRYPQFLSEAHSSSCPKPSESQAYRLVLGLSVATKISH